MLIGIADRNTLAGVVRAYSEYGNKEKVRYKPKLLVGARLVFIDGTPDILGYPRDRAAYGRLCQLLSKGKLAGGQRRMPFETDDLMEFSEGLLLVLSFRLIAISAKATLTVLRFDYHACRRRESGLQRRCSIAATTQRAWLRLQRIAATARVPLIATNDVLYHASSVGCCRMS